MIELRGKYKDYDYVVTFDTDFAYRCGYVGVSKGNKYYEKDADSINLECHGGITFSDFNDIFGPDLYWLGFDCCHNDGYDLKTLKKYCGQKAVDNFIKHPAYFYEYHKGLYAYTLDDCIKECEHIIDQLWSTERK